MGPVPLLGADASREEERLRFPGVDTLVPLVDAPSSRLRALAVADAVAAFERFQLPSDLAAAAGRDQQLRLKLIHQ